MRIYWMWNILFRYFLKYRFDENLYFYIQVNIYSTLPCSSSRSVNSLKYFVTSTVCAKPTTQNAKVPMYNWGNTLEIFPSALKSTTNVPFPLRALTLQTSKTRIVLVIYHSTHVHICTYMNIYINACYMSFISIRSKQKLNFTYPFA